MTGTLEQRLELAIAFFSRNCGSSSTAIIETLVRGARDLTDSGWWAGMGSRPTDWGDAEGNVETLAWLPPWARPQAAEIIADSIWLVHERYPDAERRDKLLAAVATIATSELPA